MIDVICGCSAPRKLPESAAGKRFKCPACSKVLQIISGEQVPEGSGAGDFDAALEISGGPELTGARLLLGGVADIQIGKLATQQIVLNGAKVSRAHCRLQRIDFGPSRWKLIDNKSTNGLFVNGQRVSEHELQESDVITVGDFQLKYVHLLPQEEPLKLADEDASEVAPASGRPGMSIAAMRGADQELPQAAGPRSAAAGGPICPSCDRALNRAAKICVDCGINVKTGRPVLTSQGVDEDSLYETAYQWIRWVSLLVWVTPMPIPIRSEAFGTRKPYAIWTIAALTTLASLAFFIAQSSGPELDTPGKELMLWAPSANAANAGGVQMDQKKIHNIARKLNEDERESLREEAHDPDGKLSDDELVAKAMAAAVAEVASSRGEFHYYQLITHAFLHDTSSIYNFAMHLAGNMLFLLVFGTRVNAMIGNIATAILYPILAVSAATVHLLSLGNGPSGPMLGASGAIMGLAGMYLILFPAHRVFCAMWISLWLRFRRIFGCKIFRLRGFWILLTYFGYDLLMNYISSHFGLSGGVAHMAHIGGFATGMVLGFGILFSRLWNTHGGDVLSVTLGKHAWPLIGKPSRWIQSPAPLPQAVSLTYR
jgi:membrane associated rhomboid family serine protease/pSer/pThr/pTyr-binding forkhead associated (FHA) protein